MAYIRQQANAEGWLRNASHLHPDKFTDIGQRVDRWLKENPAPPNPHQKPPAVKPPVSKPPSHGVHGVGNMNKQIEHAQMMHRFNRGKQGTSSLGVLLTLGGATLAGAALKMGVLATKWYLEETITDYVVNSVNYARMPVNRAQLDYAYMCYCDYSLARVANYGITPQLLSKEEWCWREYGIDMSVLR